MAKVNELVLLFSSRERKEGQGLARHLNAPPPSTEQKGGGGVPAIK